MIYIPENANGLFDMEFLEKTLKELVADENNKDRRIIGCFSVGSNINVRSFQYCLFSWFIQKCQKIGLTCIGLKFESRLKISCNCGFQGIVTDDVEVTVLMHKYGGLALWDYSAAGPHVQIVMNSVDHRKDGLFFSGKFFFFSF